MYAFDQNEGTREQRFYNRTDKRNLRSFTKLALVIFDLQLPLKFVWIFEEVLMVR